MTAATAALPLTAELILVRLAVPSKAPPAPGRVREDLGKLHGAPLGKDEYLRLRDELAAAGLVTASRQGGARLTEAGRARVLEFLGVAEFPSRSNWKTVQTKYLLPMALGVSVEQLARVTNGDSLAAFLVRRRYGVTAGASLSAVLEALACKQLGHEECKTVKELKLSLLSELLGSEERLPLKQIARQFPLVLTGAKAAGMDNLRNAVIGQWLAKESDNRPVPGAPTGGTGGSVATGGPVEETDPEATDFDLPAFAGTVGRLARSCTPGEMFGDNKAFIAPVWRRSQNEPGFPRMSLDEFKARLVESNAAGLLRLSRADLVPAMEPTLVRDSVAVNESLGAVFHFVQVAGVRS